MGSDYCRQFIPRKGPAWGWRGEAMKDMEVGPTRKWVGRSWLVKQAQQIKIRVTMTMTGTGRGTQDLGRREVEGVGWV